MPKKNTIEIKKMNPIVTVSLVAVTALFFTVISINKNLHNTPKYAEKSPDVPTNLNPGPNSNDQKRPDITIVSPLTNQTVSGKISITTYAVDDTSLNSTIISIDDSKREGCQSENTCKVEFDTKTLSNGEHTISATAFDDQGNSKSVLLNFKVNN